MSTHFNAQFSAPAWPTGRPARARAAQLCVLVLLGASAVGNLHAQSCTPRPPGSYDGARTALGEVFAPFYNIQFGTLPSLPSCSGQTAAATFVAPPSSTSAGHVYQLEAAANAQNGVLHARVKSQALQAQAAGTQSPFLAVAEVTTGVTFATVPRRFVSV